MFSKYIKLLVIGVLFDGSSSFQAIFNQSNAYLSIHHTHTRILLEKWCKPFATDSQFFII
jgi:hypothetical protein